MSHVSQSKGILLSGFEKLDPDDQERKWSELSRLSSQRNGPLRVVREKSDDGVTTLVYVRKRTLGEFLIERIIFTLLAPEQLVERQNAARVAIAHSFAPYFDKTMRALEATRGAKRHAFAQGDIGWEFESSVQAPPACRPGHDANCMAEARVRNDWLKLRKLQDAVLESSRLSPSVGDASSTSKAADLADEIEMMTLHGLHECPPGLSVVPFSPLTLICDCLIVGNKLSKSGSYDTGDSFAPVKDVYENALRRYAPDLMHEDPSQAREEIHLASVDELRHAKNLWVIPDFVQWSDRERDQHGLEDWMDFYLDLFSKAAEKEPYGSTVLEPWPSYWTTEDGVSKPVWTDKNVQGLAAAALRVRQGCLNSRQMFLSITLAIVDANLRERVEQELTNQQRGLFTAS